MSPCFKITLRLSKKWTFNISHETWEGLYVSTPCPLAVPELKFQKTHDTRRALDLSESNLGSTKTVVTLKIL